MNDQFATDTINVIDGILSSAVDKVGDIIVSSLDSSSTKQIDKIPNILGLSIAKSLRASWEIAEQEIEEGFSRYGSRSFVVSKGFTSSVSEFYSKYIPVLSSALTTRTMSSVMRSLKKSDENQESLKGAAERAGKLFKSDGKSILTPSGHALIIARTEGTRAASMSRRAVAYRAAANGRGPTYFIYKSLLDNRTTHTCKVLNNVYWLFEEDRTEYHPPSHFCCRAGVVYAWELPNNAKRLTRKVLRDFYDTQHKEFPTWQNTTEDIFSDPEKYTNEIIRTIAPTTNTPLPLTAQDKTRYAKALKAIQNAEAASLENVKKYIRSGSGDEKVRRIIARELARESEIMQSEREQLALNMNDLQKEVQRLKNNRRR